jgi:hypothetical protein
MYEYELDGMSLDRMEGRGKCHTCRRILRKGEICTETEYQDSFGRNNYYHECTKCSIKRIQRKIKELYKFIKKLRSKNG